MTLRLPPAEYAALCQQVLRRDGWKCRHCRLRNNLHVHHIIFRSHQGTDESWNLITICNGCHDGIHIAVRGGMFGLVIETPANADGEVRFIRNWNWRPQ